MKSKRQSEAGLSRIENDRQQPPHRLGFHVVEGRLVGSVQVMSAVHLALKARLLPDRVVWAELWGDHCRHWGVRIREDKRLEYRPSRAQVGWVDKTEEQKKKRKKSETPILKKNSMWRPRRTKRDSGFQSGDCQGGEGDCRKLERR